MTSESAHSVSKDLFDRITRELFQKTPGDLPEVMLRPLAPESVRTAFSLFMANQAYLVGTPSLYDPQQDESLPLHRCTDPAGMVTEGKVRPFHFLVRGFRHKNRSLPDLGVLILRNGIAFDYEQGSQWQQPEVAAFCNLLYEVTAKDPEAEIHLEHHISPDITDDFRRCCRRLPRSSQDHSGDGP